MPPPPPATPSPHRFLTGQRKAAATAQHAAPASSLRNEVSRTPAEDVNAGSTSTQFAATPRFSSTRLRPEAIATHAGSPPPPSLMRSLRTSAIPVDDVEDAATQEDNNDDEEMLDTAEHNEARLTIEFESPRQEDGNVHWSNDLALSPKKRRRLDPDVQTSLETMTQLPSSVASTSPVRGPSNTAQALTRDTLRPAFLRPSAPSHHAANDPLPQAFSPHRRGQKFVPGGMAATVQAWVLETGQAAVQSRRGMGYLMGEDYVLRVRVDEAVASDEGGSGTCVVVGSVIGEGEGVVVRVMLAGGKSESGLLFGKEVGIRAPTWEIDLSGSRWIVAADWRVLS